MEAIEAVRDQGNTVTGVVCIIDREEKGTPNVLKENNIKYSSLFKHSDFKSFIENKLKERQLTQGNTDNQF
jgi:orotate phosphoribosyltransferase